VNFNFTYIIYSLRLLETELGERLLMWIGIC